MCWQVFWSFSFAFGMEFKDTYFPHIYYTGLQLKAIAVFVERKFARTHQWTKLNNENMGI